MRRAKIILRVIYGYSQLWTLNLSGKPTLTRFLKISFRKLYFFFVGRQRFIWSLFLSLFLSPPKSRPQKTFPETCNVMILWGGQEIKTFCFPLYLRGGSGSLRYLEREVKYPQNRPHRHAWLAFAANLRSGCLPACLPTQLLRVYFGAAVSVLAMHCTASEQWR